MCALSRTNALNRSRLGHKNPMAENKTSLYLLSLLFNYGGCWVSCSGGGRRPRLQLRVDQASYITSGHFNQSRPADPAQSALGRENKPSFSPFTPKAGVLWRSAVGRSQRLQPANAGLGQHHPRRLRPASVGILPRMQPGERRSLLSALLYKKPVYYGGLLV
jgi:hypothetical protein